MNVAVYQMKKNEITGKRKAEEKKKQANDYKENKCCPEVVQRAAGQKKWSV